MEGNTIKIRQLDQDTTYGKIYLHSMPGRYEKLGDLVSDLNKLNLYEIVCLATKEEIKEISPEYLSSIGKGKLDKNRIIYNPVPDNNIPVKESDLIQYEATLMKIYQTLKAGNVLIHCAGGIGRTRTFAVIILRMYGYTFEEALKIVNEAGSTPEIPKQIDFCKNYKSKIKILKEKSCYNCQHGVPIFGHPTECSLHINGKWKYEGGYAPKELICSDWVVDDYHGWEDKYEMWKNAVVVGVE